MSLLARTVKTLEKVRVHYAAISLMDLDCYLGCMSPAAAIQLTDNQTLTEA